jgi:RHS repeat-associated protein
MGIKGEWKFVQPQIGGVNAYQYNGKELNDDYGLNWNDYGARWYDASIGRWNAVDPLAERYSSWSGYNYVLGNPLKYIDPDGMRVDDIYVNENGEFLGRDGDDDNTVRVVSQETWDAAGGVEGAQTEEGTAFLQNNTNSTPLTGNTKAQPGYQKGINISEETWGEIEDVGGARVQPHLVNGSPTHIFIKPEENIGEGNHGTVSHTAPERVESGEQVYGMVDGFSTPQYPGYVWKITSNNRIRVMHNHHVGTKGNSSPGFGIKSIIASWLKVDGWIKEDGFFNTSGLLKAALDDSWTPLFNISK